MDRPLRRLALLYRDQGKPGLAVDPDLAVGVVRRVPLDLHAAIADLDNRTSILWVRFPTDPHSDFEVFRFHLRLLSKSHRRPGRLLASSGQEFDHRIVAMDVNHFGRALADPDANPDGIAGLNDVAGQLGTCTH